MKYFNIFFIFFTLILTSCSKEELSQRIIGSWEVIELQVDSKSSIMEASESYTISFLEDGRATFLTEVNSCGLSYIANDNGGFEYSLPGCTKLCCESDFSQFILEAFRTEKIAYAISGKKLTILGSGFIKLKKVKDE